MRHISSTLINTASQTLLSCHKSSYFLESRQNGRSHNWHCSWWNVLVLVLYQTIQLTLHCQSSCTTFISCLKTKYLICASDGNLHSLNERTDWTKFQFLGEWVSEQCFTSPPTQYRLYGRRFLQVIRPNQQYQSTEGRSTKYNSISYKHSRW